MTSSTRQPRGSGSRRRAGRPAPGGAAYPAPRPSRQPMPRQSYRPASFFTGKQKLVDTGGRVDRFKKRFNLDK